MEPLPIISNDGFLHMEDLPHNCIFNKVVTGCGGTTVVLRNSEDYVIAVPTTELIINKTGRTNAGSSVLTFDGKEQSIFGLFGKFDDARKDLVSLNSNSLNANLWLILLMIAMILTFGFLIGFMLIGMTPILALM